jgi:hypothetical protein
LHSALQLRAVSTPEIVFRYGVRKDATPLDCPRNPIVVWLALRQPTLFTRHRTPLIQNGGISGLPTPNVLNTSAFRGRRPYPNKLPATIPGADEPVTYNVECNAPRKERLAAAGADRAKRA